uniref:Ig-like domain-containing protein n=1 Tax=Meloidogyne hapla TaxID=6305 RepID=A0A1I8BDV8_MELHA
MSNVEIGAYLHKYAGLWSLGLDLLPTTTQRLLHLFVYRGCGCAIDVWFKTPTTPDSLLPEKPEISKSDGRGGLFKDKDCSKRFTNEIVHSLGNISAGEKLVSFSLWSGNEGKEGLIKIYNDSKNDLIDYKNDIFVIHFYDDFIVFFPYGRDEHRKVEKVAENLLAIGAKIKVTVIISKYYIWILIESDDDVFVEFTYKFWPLYWWNGDFLNNTEVKMSIKGDFLMVTPLIIDTLNDEDKIEWSNDMKVVREMPYSLEISESTTTSINYRFYCMLNDNATAFDIKLLNGVEEVNPYVGTVIYGLDVNNNLTNVTISTDSCTDDDCVYTNLDFKSFVKGNPLECLIEVTKKGRDITIETFINGEYVNAKLESNFNIWMINRISVGGDIQLLQYRIDPKGEQIMQPDLVHRREIKELKSYGTIVCFEAYVPSAGDMDNYFIFQVKLIHDSHIRKQNDVVTVLELEFEFEPTRYPALGKNFKHIKGELFSLTVRSYDGTSREFKLYPNPIGQTGVPIFMLIYANKYFYTISVNGGDYIHYPHIFPVWSINRVEVSILERLELTQSSPTASPQTSDPNSNNSVYLSSLVDQLRAEIKEKDGLLEVKNNEIAELKNRNVEVWNLLPKLLMDYWQCVDNPRK